MVNSSDLNRLSINEATLLRQEIGGLLQRLIASRDQSERRLAETGKRDPMKFITGQTSLEKAISTAQDMLSRLDGLLNEATEECGEVICAPRALPRPALRNGLKPAARAAVLTAAP
jgi:hypothetical protein